MYDIGTTTIFSFSLSCFSSFFFILYIATNMHPILLTTAIDYSSIFLLLSFFLLQMPTSSVIINIIMQVLYTSVQFLFVRHCFSFFLLSMEFFDCLRTQKNELGYIESSIFFSYDDRCL